MVLSAAHGEVGGRRDARIARNGKPANAQTGRANRAPTTNIGGPQPRLTCQLASHASWTRLRIEQAAAPLIVQSRYRRLTACKTRATSVTKSRYSETPCHTASPPKEFV